MGIKTIGVESPEVLRALQRQESQLLQLAEEVVTDGSDAALDAFAEALRIPKAELTKEGTSQLQKLASDLCLRGIGWTALDEPSPEKDLAIAEWLEPIRSALNQTSGESVSNALEVLGRYEKALEKNNDLVAKDLEIDLGMALFHVYEEHPGVTTRMFGDTDESFGQKILLHDFFADLVTRNIDWSLDWLSEETFDREMGWLKGRANQPDYMRRGPRLGRPGFIHSQTPDWAHVRGAIEDLTSMVDPTVAKDVSRVADFLAYILPERYSASANQVVTARQRASIRRTAAVLEVLAERHSGLGTTFSSNCLAVCAHLRSGIGDLNGADPHEWVVARLREIAEPIPEWNVDGGFGSFREALLSRPRKLWCEDLDFLSRYGTGPNASALDDFGVLERVARALGLPAESLWTTRVSLRELSSEQAKRKWWEWEKQNVRLNETPEALELTEAAAAELSPLWDAVRATREMAKQSGFDFHVRCHTTPRHPGVPLSVTVYAAMEDGRFYGLMTFSRVEEGPAGFRFDRNQLEDWKWEDWQMRSPTAQLARSIEAFVSSGRSIEEETRTGDRICREERTLVEPKK